MGIKKNVLYSSILTVSGYLFPLLTYPYVSRVLGVTNIGICNFIDSIINYFILFSMLGIGTVAIREIAKDKNDKDRLSRTFSSIFLLNTVSTLIVLAGLLVSVYAVPALYEHKEMMYVGAFKLVFNYLMIEWLYKGLEDFKYITCRSVLVKSLYVIAVFLLVKQEDDYNVYYIISVAAIVVNAVINLFHSRHYLHFTLKGISLKPYIKPVLILGVYAFLTSMYTSFNMAYLGFAAGETEVGYYGTAVKLYAILLSLFGAFTGVMMPRMSALVADNDFEECRRLLDKSLNVLFLFVMPLIVFSVVYAPQIVGIIAGPGYEAAVLPMRIIMPIMLVVGYEQIIIIQILMPLKKDRAILINSILGASIGVLLNILLVSTYKSVGSACVWICSEIAVLCSAQYFVSKYMNFKFPYKALVVNILLAVPIFVSCLLLSRIPSSATVKCITGAAVIGVYYFIINVWIVRNELFVSSLRQLHSFLKSSK